MAGVLDGTVDEKVLDAYAKARRRVYLEVTSPVSSESKRIVFNCDDAERKRWDFSVLKWRLEDEEAMRRFMSVPALLETPCLLSGKTLAEKLRSGPLR